MFIRKPALLLSLLLASLLPLSAAAERLPTTSPGADAARIIGSPGYAGRDLFEVNFLAINGRNIPPRHIIWLEPGTYQITVQIDAAHVMPPQRRLPQRAPGHNVIELELEAGKSYRILARYNRDEPDQDFTVILYSVDEMFATEE